MIELWFVGAVFRGDIFGLAWFRGPSFVVLGSPSAVTKTFPSPSSNYLTFVFLLHNLQARSSFATPQNLSFMEEHADLRMDVCYHTSRRSGQTSNWPPTDRGIPRHFWTRLNPSVTFVLLVRTAEPFGRRADRKVK